MRRWIYAHEHVNGQAARLEKALRADLHALLRRATGADDQEPAADGSFLVNLATDVAGFDVAKQVRVWTGAAHNSDGRLVIPIAWAAEPGEFAFPTFSGSLELEDLAPTYCQLTLVGSYQLPLGPLGVAADATMLEGVAQRTAARLVEEIARELSRGIPQRSSDELQRSAARRSSALRVRDVMTRNPIALDPGMPLKTAALLLFHADVSGAPVVAADGTLIGVLSERDLLAKEAPRRFGLGRAAAADERRWNAHTVGDACTRPALVTVPSARLADVARELLDRDVSRLVVIDEARVAGIVSIHDVLAALVCDDAEIRAVIQAVLDERGEPDMKAEVSWGEVALSGTTELRTNCLAIIESVRHVDGVMAVDASGLAWRYDDVVPTVPMAPMV